MQGTQEIKESSLNSRNMCSPQRRRQYNATQSCFLPNELKNIVKIYNSQSPVKIDTNKSDKDIIKQITNGKCTSDHCLLQIPSLQSHLKNIFKPPKPSTWYVNNTEWLSSIDIDNVLVQYIDNYFDFLGVFPIDFSSRIHGKCVSEEICDIDSMMSRLISMRKESFAIVFNLDRHDQGGSHWVCMYCNIDPTSKLYGISYYDSVRDMVLSHKNEKDHVFLKFMKGVKKYMEKKDNHNAHRFKIRMNKIQRQFKNTECGMYCIIFIITCLENHKTHTFKSICKNMKDDDEVNTIRDVLFASFK